MKCNKCSHNNKENAYFCVNCGTKLRNKNNVWMIVAGVLFAILLINLFRSDDNSAMQNELQNVKNELSNQQRLNKELSRK